MIKYACIKILMLIDFPDFIDLPQQSQRYDQTANSCCTFRHKVPTCSICTPALGASALKVGPTLTVPPFFTWHLDST